MVRGPGQVASDHNWLVILSRPGCTEGLTVVTVAPLFSKGTSQVSRRSEVGNHKRRTFNTRLSTGTSAGTFACATCLKEIEPRQVRKTNRTGILYQIRQKSPKIGPDVWNPGPRGFRLIQSRCTFYFMSEHWYLSKFRNRTGVLRSTLKCADTFWARGLSHSEETTTTTTHWAHFRTC